MGSLPLPALARFAEVQVGPVFLLVSWAGQSAPISFFVRHGALLRGFRVLQSLHRRLIVFSLFGYFHSSYWSHFQTHRNLNRTSHEQRSLLTRSLN
jgi:hypothetical protein